MKSMTIVLVLGGVAAGAWWLSRKKAAPVATVPSEPLPVVEKTADLMKLVGRLDIPPEAEKTPPHLRASAYSCVIVASPVASSASPALLERLRALCAGAAPTTYETSVLGASATAPTAEQIGPLLTQLQADPTAGGPGPGSGVQLQAEVPVPLDPLAIEPWNVPTSAAGLLKSGCPADWAKAVLNGKKACLPWSAPRVGGPGVGGGCAKGTMQYTDGGRTACVPLSPPVDGACPEGTLVDHAGTPACLASSLPGSKGQCADVDQSYSIGGKRVCTRMLPAFGSFGADRFWYKGM